MQIDMQEFLRMLTNRHRQPEKITSYKPQHQLVSKETLENYSEQLRTIYDHFFNDRKNDLQIDKYVTFKVRKTQVPLCNKLFKHLEPVYKCYECFIHEAAVLCEECFEKGHHEGHRFKKFPSGGGNCDCGNELALKKEGFCINHTGTVKRPTITQEQKHVFNYIIGSMLEWFFKLLNHRSPFAETFGTILIGYLRKLNKQSIFYNLLTHGVLTRKSSKDTTCLSQFFKIKKGNIPVVLNELFFQMFALDEFKLELANEYLNAYNTIPDFEETSFHSLYIQLFANDNIVIDLVNKYKNTILVIKKQYKEDTYLSDLQFITSINEKPAMAFFDLYFQKNKYVPLAFLNDIEKLFEKENAMHEVDVVTRYINQQFYFYIMSEDIFAKIVHNHQLLVKIVKELLLNLTSKKYSYRRNKAVLPYHRTYAMGLFTLFEGNISQMSVKELSQKLCLPQETIVNLYFETSSHIMECLLDFSETYGRRNYFDNYIVLYARAGVAPIKYDQLFLKEAASILKSANLTFQSQLMTKFCANAKVVLFDQDPTNIAQFLQKWINFCTLLVEIATTSTSEIGLNTKLKINNTHLNKLQSQLFRSIVKKVGQVSKQEISVIQKYFTGTLDDKFFIENTEFDRVTKKYQAKKDKEGEEVPEFLYELYMSRRKVGQTLLKEQDGKPFIALEIKAKQPVELLKILIPKSFVNQIIEFVSNNLEKVEKKREQSIVISFLSLLKKLSVFSPESFSQEMTKISKYLHEQILPEENQKQTQNLRREVLKKNLNSKKAKMMMKQQKFLQLHENQICKLQEGESDLVCILCRENEKQGLCYFSNLKYKKLMSGSIKQNKLGFIYSSCFHTAHYECFKKLIKNNHAIQCPLCKSPINILLPVVYDFENSIFRKIVERIKIIAFRYFKLVEEQEVKYDENFCVFRSIMESLVEYIGFVGVINQGELKRKFWRICKELLKLMMREWSSFTDNQKQKLYQTMGQRIKTENNPNDIVDNVRHFIVSIIFGHLQGKQVQISKRAQIQKNNINSKDLKIIEQNLLLIFDQDEKMETEMSIGGNELPQLQSLYQFYQLPKTVKELIKERDEKTSKNCKKGHSVFICCECQELVCAECKTITPHNISHGNEAVYFCLLSGGLNIYLSKKIIIPSLYENSLGVSWTYQKQPDGFELNNQIYKQIQESIMIHSIENYLRKKMPKLLESAQMTQIVIFEEE